MKTFIALFLALGAFTAHADEVACTPASEVICVISSYCDANTTAYYSLKTNFISVDTIFVDARIAGVCKIDPALGATGLKKLQAQAEQLKEAGACAVIIDNVSP